FGGASRLRDPGLIYFYAMLAPGRTHEEVEAAIREVVDEVRRDGIDEAELQRAKNQRYASEAFGRDGSFAIASQLNEAIAAGDWRLYTTLRSRIEKVSMEDVQNAAKRYLVDDQRTLGLYIPIQEAAE